MRKELRVNILSEEVTRAPRRAGRRAGEEKRPWRSGLCASRVLVHGAGYSTAVCFDCFPLVNCWTVPNIVSLGGKIPVVTSEGEEIFSGLTFEQNQDLRSPSSSTQPAAETNGSCDHLCSHVPSL